MGPRRDQTHAPGFAIGHATDSATGSGICLVMLNEIVSTFTISKHNMWAKYTKQTGKQTDRHLLYGYV